MFQGQITLGLFIWSNARKLLILNQATIFAFNRDTHQCGFVLDLVNIWAFGQ